VVTFASARARLSSGQSGLLEVEVRVQVECLCVTLTCLGLPDVNQNGAAIKKTRWENDLTTVKFTPHVT
jgi:hypothetical protein